MDVKRAVILGNYQAGKTTIVSAFAGITREAALQDDGRQDYLYGAKEIHSGNTGEVVVLQGIPRPWGRVSIFRASTNIIEDATAFIIALRMDDPLAAVKRFFTRIEGRQNKTPAPVLVLVRNEGNGRTLPMPVTAYVKEKGAMVVEFLRDELHNRTESAVRSLYEAVSVLLSTPALATAPLPPKVDADTRKPLPAPKVGARTRKPLAAAPKVGARTRKPRAAPKGDAGTQKPLAAPKGDAGTQKPLAAPKVDARPQKPLAAPAVDAGTQKPLVAPRPKHQHYVKRTSKPKPVPQQKASPVVPLQTAVVTPEVEDKKKDEKRERLTEASVRVVPLALGS